MSEINIGDVVRLKSGGPNMTVDSLGESMSGQNSAWVSWFDKNLNPQNGTYPITSLDVREKSKS